VATRRGVGLVLVLIGLAVMVSLAGMVFMYAMVSRGPSVPSSAILVLRPGGNMPETVPDDVVGQVLGREVNTVRGFIEGLSRAKRDPRIKTVLLMPSTIEMPFWAKVQEMRDAVVDFKTSGKTVVAFLEYGGDREYYLASAADKVFLLPTSPLDLAGVASYEIFLRGLFDKIGATPDFVKIGDYKTAVNQYTERAFTPAHREMAESLNREAFDQLVRGIAEGRKKTEEEVRALLDQGPFLPADAMKAGLVDDLVYADQIDDKVPEFRDDDRELRRVEGTSYERSGGVPALRARSRIAVIQAVGTIVSGRSALDPINGALVGSETVVEQIRRVRDDDSVRAIIVRIDSPGGSSVASDVIWRELMITREENPDVPIISSMSDLAASGGYYIAMPGEVIVAEPGTLTGSIGIFSGKIALGGTLDKIGVTRETVLSGANAGIYSPFDPFTDAHRRKLDGFMQAFYQGFVDKAAESRDKTFEEIDAVARGRVWTGRQAKEHGLVDELGGLETAVRIAKERANIPEDEDVQLVVYPPRRTLYEALAESLGGANSALGVWQALAGDADARAVGAAMAPARIFRRGEPLALLPFTFVR
jgi:protease IV